jgi:hypothetical protein
LWKYAIVRSRGRKYIINNKKYYNIFQVYQYFTIYWWYFFLKFYIFHEYLMQHSLKLGGTNYHCKWVKYLVLPLIERPAIICTYGMYCITMHLCCVNFITTRRSITILQLWKYAIVRSRGRKYIINNKKYYLLTSIYWREVPFSTLSPVEKIYALISL